MAAGNRGGRACEDPPAGLDKSCEAAEQGAWGMEQGAWSMEHGAWSMGHGRAER